MSTSRTYVLLYTICQYGKISRGEKTHLPAGCFGHPSWPPALLRRTFGMTTRICKGCFADISGLATTRGIDISSRSALIVLRGDMGNPLNTAKKEGVHDEATGDVMPEEFSLDALLAGQRWEVLETQRGAHEGSRAPRVL
jgi:hypothetical protein